MKVVVELGITEKNINELINSLNDVDYDVRNSIGDILVKTGKTAIPFLIDSLKHDDPEIQVESARILGRLGNEEAIEPLIAALKDENVRLRKEAALSINKIIDKNKNNHE